MQRILLALQADSSFFLQIISYEGSDGGPADTSFSSATNRGAIRHISGVAEIKFWLAEIRASSRRSVECFPLASDSSRLRVYSRDLVPSNVFCTVTRK